MTVLKSDPLLTNKWGALLAPDRSGKLCPQAGDAVLVSPVLRGVALGLTTGHESRHIMFC